VGDGGNGDAAGDDNGAASEASPRHRGSEEQQKIIDYAWKISHDREFIYLLKAENGEISVDRKSPVNSNGYRDYGLCQINKGYHPGIVNDERFSDYKWQLDQCYRLYKGGTTFYGLIKYRRNTAFRKKIEDSFTWEG